MRPFYFGSSDRPLLGVYHAPQDGLGQGRGALLCYPMGQEYLRSHRAFRQLANLLARAGLHVLRFDYHATGDSAGDCEAADIEQWIEDVRTAATELREMAQLTRLSVAGLRLGAALATLACSRGIEDVDSLVLWDPIVRGSDYVRELRALAGASTGTEPRGIEGAMGFPLTPALQAGLAGIDLTALPSFGVSRVHIVVSADRESAHQLRAWLEPRVALVQYRHVPAAGSWTAMDDVGSALLPHEIIRTVVGMLAEEAA